MDEAQNSGNDEINETRVVKNERRRRVAKEVDGNGKHAYSSNVRHLESDGKHLEFIEAQIRKCVKNQILEANSKLTSEQVEYKVSELFETLLEEAESETTSKPESEIQTFQTDSIVSHHDLTPKSSLGLVTAPPSLKTFDYLPRKYGTISQTGLALSSENDVFLSDLSLKANASCSDISSLTSIDSADPTRSNSLSYMEVFSIKKYWTTNLENLQRTFGLPAYLDDWTDTKLSKTKSIVRPWTEQSGRLSNLHGSRRKKIPEHSLRKSVPNVCFDVSEEKITQIAQQETSGRPKTLKFVVVSGSGSDTHGPDNGNEQDAPEEVQENLASTEMPKDSKSKEDFNNNNLSNHNKEFGATGSKTLVVGHVNVERDVQNHNCALCLLPLPWYDNDDNFNPQLLETTNCQLNDDVNYIKLLSEKIELESDWRSRPVSNMMVYNVKSTHAKRIQKFLRMHRRKPSVKVTLDSLGKANDKQKQQKLEVKHVFSVSLSAREFDSEERLLMAHVENILATGEVKTVPDPPGNNTKQNQMVDAKVSTTDLQDPKKFSTKIASRVPSGLGQLESGVSEIFRKYVYDQTSSTVSLEALALANPESIWTSVMRAPQRNRERKLSKHDTVPIFDNNTSQTQDQREPNTNTISGKWTKGQSPNFEFIVGPSPRNARKTTTSWASKFIPKWFRKARTVPVKEPKMEVKTDKNGERAVDLKETCNVGHSRAQSLVRKKLWEPKYSAEKLPYKSYYERKGKKPRQKLEQTSQESLVACWKLTEVSKSLTNMSALRLSNYEQASPPRGQQRRSNSINSDTCKESLRKYK